MNQPAMALQQENIEIAARDQVERLEDFELQLVAGGEAITNSL